MRKLHRRAFLLQAAGFGLGISLLNACSPAAPSPTAAPAKPAAEPTKPAAPAASPAAGASPAPAASPSPGASAPARVSIAAPPLAGPTTKVSYGMASANPYHIVALTAVEKPDLIRKYNVEFDLVLLGNSPSTVQAVVGGSLNFGAVTPESAWPAQAQTSDLFQVMAVANGTPYTVFANPEIKKVTDLKGKSLGVSALKGGADTTALQIMLLENGLQPGDYQLLQVGSVAERTAAMKANTIAGCAQLEPQATQLRDAGFPVLDSADNYQPLKGSHTVIVLAKKGWYETEPAVNFAKAFVEISNWLYDPKNRDETIAIMTKTMNVDAKAAGNAYDLHIVKARTPTPNGRIDPKMIAQSAENQRRIGGTGIPDDPTKFVDDSLMKKALG